MGIQRINPAGLLSFDLLSQVVIASPTKTVYIAGQSACDENFEVIGAGDYFAQAAQALRHLRVAVEAAGGKVEQIVSSTIYIKNLTPEASERVLAAWSTALDGQPFPPHAFSIIGVQSLASPEVLVEISAVAAL